jgi:acyl dehydratase
LTDDITYAVTEGSWWFEDLPIGHSETSPELSVDRDEMLDYARRNDPWPVHLDRDAAVAAGFADIIASFGYTTSLLFRLNHDMEVTQRLQPSFIAAVSWQVQMRAAVVARDRLRLRNDVINKRLSSSGERGVVTTRCTILNQHDGEAVITDVTSLVRTRTTRGALVG